MHLPSLLGLLAICVFVAATPVNTDRSVEDSNENYELLRSAMAFLKNFGDDSSSRETTEATRNREVVQRNQGKEKSLLDRLFEDSGEKGRRDDDNDTSGALLTWLVKLALKSYFQ